MNRYRLSPIAVVGLVLGCAGHQRGSAPAPVAPAATATRSPAAAEPRAAAPAPTAAAPESLIPPAPVIDTSIDRALAAEQGQEADSAADEAALQKIAEARAPGSGEDQSESEAVTAEKALTGSGTTWDIDVATYNNHDRVQYYLDFFQTHARDRMSIWLERMSHYEPMVRHRLQQEGLPGDLVYLALIESGFSNSAVSRARAVGMWQFMKGTGRLYGLRVDRWVDERRDPVKATDAAARYLSDLYRKFNSVYLAAAAYNAGGGRIGRSLDRIDDDDEDSDSLYTDAGFFRLYDTKLLHKETRDYVPKLIAAALIAKEPAKYGFSAPAATEPEAYDSIVVPDMTGLDVIARLADTTLAAIRELNPQYLRLATPPATRSVVRLPAGRGASAAAGYASLPASERVTFHTYVVGRSESTGSIARKYHITDRALLAANPGLRSGRVRAGRRLFVPDGGAASALVARQMAEPAPTIYHRVRRGETLAAIADRYDVSTAQLRSWNRLAKHARLRRGMRLRVAPKGTTTTPVATRKRPATAVATTGVERPHAKGADGGDGPKAARVRTHVVRRGETLTAVARRYGISLDALAEANGLTSRSKVRAGVALRIPA
jgi:membrane-bound lytic murein transglycosylase D